MKFLIRALKLIIVVAINLVALPFTIFMMFVGLFAIFPSWCIFYIVDGDCDRSFDRAMDFCLETLWCEIGLAPEIISGKLLDEETY